MSCGAEKASDHYFHLAKRESAAILKAFQKIAT